MKKVGSDHRNEAHFSRTRKGLTQINELSWSVAEKIYRRHGFARSEIMRQWERIVGKDLSQACRPEQLRFSPSKKPDTGDNEATAPGAGVLTIRAESTAALELQHSAPQIIERINSYFGFMAVGRLKIIQDSLPRKNPGPRKPQKELSPRQNEVLSSRLERISNPSLRNALSRLGERVLRSGEDDSRSGPKSRKTKI